MINFHCEDRARGWPLRGVAIGCLVLMTGSLGAQGSNTPASVSAAGSVPVPTSAPPVSATAVKDVVLDTPVPVAAGGRIVATPGVSPGVVPATTENPAPPGLDHRDRAMAAAVADLGLAMLRAQSATTGQAQRNAVVAPVSLASALGMVHAGVAGASADEIAGLLGAAPAWGTVFSRDYPALLGRLRSAGPALASANRIWVDASLVTGLPASYQAAVTGRYQSEGAVVSFSQPAAARKSINQWAADHTGQRIRELLPTDAITANTRVVLTNAMHFKSPWQQAFSPDATTPRPFYRSDLTAQNVPTMVKSMSVRMGRVDNVEIVEIPFASGAFALTVAMPPKGHTLNAFETDLSGQDMAAWSPQLHEARCRVELPRFAISPQSVALKEILKRMGMKTVFSPQADFSPMLGRKAGGIELDNVYQSAGIQVDENGSEAVAATAAVASFKSMPLDTPAVCAVNRPFVFAITHVPTGTPVFVGKVAQPAGL